MHFILMHVAILSTMLRFVSAIDVNTCYMYEVSNIQYMYVQICFFSFQATSLSCSHSFCALCIAEWMKVKRECPICRTPVTSQMRSIALDNYIDTMVEHLSEELKIRRKQLVAARKGKTVSCYMYSTHSSNHKLVIILITSVNIYSKNVICIKCYKVCIIMNANEKNL